MPDPGHHTLTVDTCGTIDEIPREAWERLAGRTTQMMQKDASFEHPKMIITRLLWTLVR